MAISLYSGTPGSFKSYHATCEILDALKYGRNVISNFPVNFKRVHIKSKGVFEYWSNDNITVDNLLNFAREHHHDGYEWQTLVVIDEAATKFNSRDFGRADRLAWINFLSNHRHFNFRFILIAQNDMMLDKQIRGLIEYEVKHRAVANYNFVTMLISKAVKGVYATVEYWYPCRMRCGGSFHKFNRKKADCYDTMALFIDNPFYDNSVVSTSEKQKKSNVVFITKSKEVKADVSEAITDNDRQPQDGKTTTLVGNLSYDNDTGVVVYDDAPKSYS